MRKLCGSKKLLVIATYVTEKQHVSFTKNPNYEIIDSDSVDSDTQTNYYNDAPIETCISITNSLDIKTEPGTSTQGNDVVESNINVSTDTDVTSETSTNLIATSNI